MLRRTPALEPLIASGRIEVLDQYSQGDSPLILARGMEADLRGASDQRVGRRVRDSIHLRSRKIDTTLPRSAPSPPAGGGRLEIVQFHGPVKPEWLARLRTGARARPIAYLPENAYLVWAEQPDRLASSGLPLQWRESFAEQDRLSPELVSSTEPIDVTIQVARAGRYDEVLDEIRSLAIAVLMEPRPFGPVTHVRVTLPAGVAARIARNAEVVWIEPFARPEAHDERTALTTAGLVSGHRPVGLGYESWLASRGLGDLSAVLVDVTDSGIDRGPPETTHPGLEGRVAYSVDGTDEGDLQDCAGHGTNVAGIIAGFPSAACALLDEEGYSGALGVAPTARVGATRIFTCAGIFAPSVPFADLVAGAYARGARLGNNSWGGRGSQYNTLTAEYDALVRDANLDPLDGDQGFLAIFSAGNLGPQPLTVGWPATAKNVLSVGASESFRPSGPDGCGAGDTLADSVDHVLVISGRGPTGDGRIKPDLIAPGSHVISLASTALGYDGAGVCDLYFPVGQRLLNWSTGTSQAAAHVSGAAAVATEIYRQRHGAVPSPAMIKAMLIAQAHDMANTVQVPSNTVSRPNMDQGWGRVDLGSLVDSKAEVVVDQQVILKGTGESAPFQPIVVDDPSRPVVVTLAWTDAPGTPAGWSWVNDLDLVVRSAGATYLGNVIQSGVSVTGGEADERNNVEVVILPPGHTLLSVDVEAANIAGDGVPSAAGETDQDFALYMSNARLPTPAGIVTLPQGSATCGSPLEVRVSDLSLRGFGRARVRVDSGADLETVLLDETPPASGVFKAAVSVLGGAPSPGDGLIQAADGVGVVVTYVESDPLSGELVERTATVPGRCAPPLITGARLASSGSGEATVAWETDRPSTSEVRYGEGSVRDRLVTDPKPVTRHRVRLSGLSACAFHTATVRSADSAGLSADAPATPLTFSTGKTSTRRIQFRDDMEGLGSRWQHHALAADPLATDDWELGFPGAGPPRPFSGTRVWGTNLDGAYSERLDAALVSPAIDLRDAVGSQLAFIHYYSINGSLPPFSRNDGGWVEISADGGMSWAALDPVGGYSDLIDDDNPHLPHDSTVYAGTTAGWIRAVFDLSPYDGNVVRVRFHIWQDAGESAPRLFGWYIDDVEVTAQGRCHEARLGLDSDEYGCSSRVVVTLEDSDLDVDPSRADAVQVTASSASGSHLVTLVETGPATGTLRGVLTLRPTAAPGLLVSEGDAITVTYDDRDRGDGSPSVTSASALVPDCTPPPPPSGVAVAPDGSGRVMVSWEPLEPAAAPDLQGYRIHYDTDGSGPSYTGTGAEQGASPVRLEASLSTMGLSSLSACSPYFITVTAFDRLGNESTFAPESFAVADGPQPCATGRISMAPASPGCAQLVILTLADTNLDTDPTTPGTATARATNPSHAGEVAVALVESSPSSRTFVGTLALSPVPQAGALQVSQGDVIRVEYADADDGFGAARTASASDTVSDCTPPVISGVEVVETRSDTAIVRWVTDEPATSTVRYGSDPTSLGLTLPSPPSLALTSQHSIRIPSLSPCSPVFFTVSSADAAANSATATDSGSPFRFGTFRDIPIFVDDFGTGAPGWSHDGTHDEWQLGAPPLDPNGPPPPYSGGVVWGTDLGGTYEKGADIVLASPPIDLTEVESAYLTFTHWYQIASSPGPPNGFDDGGFLEVSRDGGGTWQYLPHGDPLRCAQGRSDCYPDRITSNPYTPFAAGAYAGSSGGWVSARVSLDDHRGHVVRVRFHLYQDAGEISLPRALGWYIDDVTVTFGEACRSGRVVFDRDEYPCSSEARLSLSDLDLDADPAAAETASVLVFSGAEPAGEVLTLAETGASTALFETMLPLSSTDAPGVLQVRHQDSITASYLDTDDGTGSGLNATASARVLDCIAPAASGVRITAVGHTGFTVAWETPEPAAGRVLFGTDPSLGGATAPGSLGTQHVLAVTGLSPCRLHFFTVESRDSSGNAAREDATAGLRQVTTLGQGVLLEERFESGASRWRRSGQGTGWQVGGPADPAPPSGSSAAGAPLSGAYARPREANEDFVLESPPLNLAGLTEPTLTFQHSFDFATSFLGGDGGRVEAWDGSRWIALTPEGGYPGFLDHEAGRTGERIPGYSGSSQGYVPARFDLGPNATGPSPVTRIRFRVFVEAGAEPTGLGWRIDDVRIVGTLACRLARLAFDRGDAACEAPALSVTLHDTDLDLDPLATDSAVITLESSGGPGPLPILMTEQEVAGGSLRGEAPLSADGGPDTLRAVAGDLITATYEDENDGGGAMRTNVAQIRISGCPAPSLSRVVIASSGDGSVLARWVTDQPSTSELTLSPASGPAVSIADLGLVTGHSLEASGVAPCATYAASLASENAEGSRGALEGAGGLLVETVDRQVLFFDDMEGADPGWTSAGAFSEWERGAPVFGPQLAFSGLRVFGTDLDGVYEAGTDATLTSPPIDLRGIPAAQLTFWHWYEIFASDTPNSFDDAAWLEVKPQGENAVRVEPLGGYPDLSDGESGSPLVEGTPVYAGNGAGWERASFDLSRFAGKVVNLRFRLWNDALEVLSNGVTGPGWYIDDVEVFAPRFCHPAPSITSGSLGTALQGESIPGLGVQGSGLRPGAAVSLGSGVTASSLTVEPPTRITFNLLVDAAAAPGLRDLTVTNPDGQAVVVPAALLVRASPGASDIDGSGRVDGNDLVLLAGAFGAAEGSPSYRVGPDINRDGIVDGLDLAVLAASFGAVLR